MFTMVNKRPKRLYSCRFQSKSSNERIPAHTGFEPVYVTEKQLPFDPKVTKW
jgi:hypothetical protein